jgi:hypothetical protein
MSPVNISSSSSEMKRQINLKTAKNLESSFLLLLFIALSYLIG